MPTKMYIVKLPVEALVAAAVARHLVHSERKYFYRLNKIY